MTASRQFRAAGLGLMIVTAASPLAAEGPVLRIPKADCAHLVRHAPAPDVTYQPGIDVRGRATAPADLESGVEIVTPDHFLIPIEVDLAARLGIPASPDNGEADAFIGLVEVRGERTYFNGQLLQNEAEAELAAICRQATLEP